MTNSTTSEQSTIRQQQRSEQRFWGITIVLLIVGLVMWNVVYFFTHEEEVISTRPHPVYEHIPAETISQIDVSSRHEYCETYGCY